MDSIIWFFEKLGPGLGAFLGAIVGGLLAFFGNYWIQERKLKHEKAMYFLQNLTNEKAKGLLSEALYHQKFPIRSFEHLQYRVPLEESRVRELLIELDAKRATLEDGREGYYLREREQEVFAKLEKRRDNKSKS